MPDQLPEVLIEESVLKANISHQLLVASGLWAWLQEDGPIIRVRPDSKAQDPFGEDCYLFKRRGRGVWIGVSLLTTIGE